MKKKLILNLTFLIFSSFCIAQKHGQALLDSLLIELPKAKEDTNKVKLLANISYFNHKLSPNEGIKYGEQSLRLAIKLGWKKGIANANNSLGVNYKTKAEYPKALTYYFEALKIHEELSDKSNAAINLNNIGLIYGHINNSNKALEYFLKALKLNEEIGNNNGKILPLINIGVFYGEQKDYKNALTYFLKASKIIEKVGNKNELAQTLGNIGIIYFEQKNYLKALEYFLKVSNLFEEINDKSSLARAKGNIGNLYLTLAKELPLNESEGLKNGISISKGDIPLIDRKNALIKACEYFETSSDIFKNLGELDALQNSYLFQFEAMELLGDYKGALYSYKKSVEIKDSIFSEENKNKIDVLSKQREEDLKQKEIEIQKLQIEAHQKQRSYFISVLIVLLFFAVFIFRSLRASQKQKYIIEKQKELVEEKHKEITDSINYAERIQRSFLASKELLDENLKDYFVLFNPKDVVSGDFFWASKLSNGNFAIATADSTGHGVPGAIMSLLNITSLEKAIEQNNEPADILNATRKTIIERLKKDGSTEGGKDGMDCSLTIYDFNTNKLFITAANNPVWIIRGDEAIEIKPDKMPVGKHDRQDIPFTQQTIELKKGDVVYTLTDGFSDQFGGVNGKKFMSKNLRELLAKNAHLSMSEQKELLQNTFKNWVRDFEQVDDVCIVGIRV